MTLVAEARHQVAIAGVVGDARTGRPLAEARVELVAAPGAFTDWLALRAQEEGSGWVALEERPDRTLTGGDGHFHFLDLPDGQYTVKASLPVAGSRYGTAQASASITRTPLGAIVRQAIDLNVPPTTVKGKVTGPAAKAVPLAEVRLRGSPARALTDSAGDYALAPVEAGKQAVLVSAPGFQKSASKLVEAKVGLAVPADFELTP
jgi:hypothetical protein